MPQTDHSPLDYSKLPPSPPVDKVFLLDPLIATGGTACAALAMLVDWGISSKYKFPPPPGFVDG